MMQYMLKHLHCLASAYALPNAVANTVCGFSEQCGLNTAIVTTFRNRAGCAVAIIMLHNFQLLLDVNTCCFCENFRRKCADSEQKFIR